MKREGGGVGEIKCKYNRGGSREKESVPLVFFDHGSSFRPSVKSRFVQSRPVSSHLVLFGIGSSNAVP